MWKALYTSYVPKVRSLIELLHGDYPRDGAFDYMCINACAIWTIECATYIPCSLPITILHLEAHGSLLEMYWIMRTCLTTSTYQESQYQTMINVEMTPLCYENIMEPKDRNMVNTVLVVCLPLTFINSMKLYTHFTFCRLLVVVPYIMGVHQWILRKFVTFHHLFAP